MLSPSVASKVAALFDLGRDAQVVGEPARGELGEVWPVQTDRGKWAVKRAFERHEEQEEEPNAAFAELVFARGITTPQTIRTPDGNLFAEVEGQQFRAYSWVDIADPDPNISPMLVGRLLASLHRLDVHRDEEVHYWYTEPVGVQTWAGLAEDLSTRGCRLAPALAEYVDELARLAELVQPPRNLQVCHRDLWADNVRQHLPGGLCVFDWEDAGSCDPSHELAVALFEYARSDPSRARALMASYVDSGGPGRITGRGSFTMAIAQIGHLGERAARIWLDTDSPEERLRIESNLEEVLEVRLTVAGIDLLIEAAQTAEDSAYDL